MTNTQKQCPRCKCGGQFSAGGWEKVRFANGLGFLPGTTRFQVEYVVVHRYTGFCMKCGSTEPVEYAREIVIEYPESINNAIVKKMNA